jgi:hypothetical protein
LLVKPDLVTVQATHIDAIGFRLQLTKYRHLFNKVILSWSYHHYPENMVSWIENIMAPLDIQFISILTVNSQPYFDWYQRAIMAAMKETVSNCILVTEQDFIVKNENFYSSIFNDDNKLVTHHIPYQNNNINGSIRMNPDFIYFNKYLWEQSSKDVAADYIIKPPRWDAWGGVTHDFMRLCPEYKQLEDLNMFSPTDWEHLQGLTYNYSCCRPGGNINCIHNRKRFGLYNREMLNSGAAIHPVMLPLIKRAIEVGDL